MDLQFSSFWKNYFFLQFKLRATDFVKSKQAHFFSLKKQITTTEKNKPKPGWHGLVVESQPKDRDPGQGSIPGQA